MHKYFIHHPAGIILVQ